MSELPPGWAETTIGDVLQFNYGKGLPERDRSGRGIPVYGSNGVVGYHGKALVSAESLVIGRKGSVGEVHHSQGPCSNSNFGNQLVSNCDSSSRPRIMKSIR